jgi:hypothetical protein
VLYEVAGRSAALTGVVDDVVIRVEADDRTLDELVRVHSGRERER